MALASHWLEDCANFTPTAEENDQHITATNTLSAIQAASQSTFINAQLYSTLISVIVKNKQLILVSQSKLALAAKNMYTSCVIKSLEYLKSLINGPVLYLGQN
jgi:hypothetical protein